MSSPRKKATIPPSSLTDILSRRQRRGSTGKRGRAREAQEYYDTADRIRIKPGWMQGEGQPMPEIEPYLWRWSQVEPLVMKSGELVTPDRDVERRTLRLATPGIDRGTTHTITAALQLLLPGENAPAHRHTPTAIRWVLKGQGAYTTVEGDKCYMEPGDLVLTRRRGPGTITTTRAVSLWSGWTGWMCHWSAT